MGPMTHKHRVVCGARPSLDEADIGVTLPIYALQEWSPAQKGLGVSSFP